jgi:hypothetical protein
MKLIFCNGQPKSGSTFFFSLVNQLVPHVELRTTNEALRDALAGNEAARKILYLQNGEYTGYVNGGISRAAHAFATLPLPGDARLVVKTHDPEPAAAALMPPGTTIITTFRDPLDVMMALRDQADRERLRPAGTVRPGFLANATHARALASAAEFTARLLRSFSPSNWYLEYPAFVRPLPDQAAMLAAMLGVDERRITETVASLDHDIRSGRVIAEFNRGEAGRGRQIIDELVRNGSVPLGLAQQAVAWHRELVGLVARHRQGIIARQ